MVVAAVGPTGSTPSRPAIDTFSNHGGGRCWTHRQHPQGGPPSTSSPTTVVAAVGPTDSTPRGAVIDVFSSYNGGIPKLNHPILPLVVALHGAKGGGVH
jgi:hypothetical protein